MSIILRYRTTCSLYYHVTTHFGHDFWAERGRFATQHNRFRRSGWEHWSFSARLPEDLPRLVRLLGLMSQPPASEGRCEWSRSRASLLRRLRRDLGLTEHPAPGEVPFIEEVCSSSGATEPWLVYRDWLLEYGDAARGEKISRWLSGGK